MSLHAHVPRARSARPSSSTRPPLTPAPRAGLSQKRPLLVRGAIPSFQSPIGGDELAGLACERDAPSRIIVATGDADKPWELVRARPPSSNPSKRSTSNVASTTPLCCRGVARSKRRISLS